MSNRIKSLIIRMCYMILIPLVSLIHFYLNQYREPLHSVKTFIDDLIPFNSIWVIPYLWWFAYVYILLVFFAVCEYREYFKMLASLVVGMGVCFIIFIFYQTYTPRPYVEPNGIFNWMVVTLIYGNDKPYDCFPSIHVLNALIPTIYFCKYWKGWILRVIVILNFLAISLSTMFLKQHYFMDALSAIIIGFAVYALFNSKTVLTWIKSLKISEYILPNSVKSNFIDISLKRELNL